VDDGVDFREVRVPLRLQESPWQPRFHKYFLFSSQKFHHQQRMVAYNQAILFAHPVQSTTFVPKTIPSEPPSPSILALKKDLELHCQTTIRTVLDNQSIDSSHSYRYTSPQHMWNDDNCDFVSYIHNIIPKEQEFHQLLALNAAGIYDDLGIQMLYWSEAEILYMRHRFRI
jgi:hypothetical protein